MGRDYLNGGAGDDRLIGGPGADVFQFRAAYGRDAIADFEPGDIPMIAIRNGGLGLNGLGYPSRDDLIARLSDGEAGAVLDLGAGNGVVFEGLDAEALNLLQRSMYID